MRFCVFILKKVAKPGKSPEDSGLAPNVLLGSSLGRALFSHVALFVCPFYAEEEEFPHLRRWYVRPSDSG